MLSIISERGKPVYGLKEFILDYEKEIKNLPIDCANGSRAYVIENKKVYILNSFKRWEEM